MYNDVRKANIELQNTDKLSFTLLRKEVDSCMDNLLSKFKSIDEDFSNYLGFEKCECKADSVKLILKLLLKEDDGKHIYWIVRKDNEIVALLYLYDYKSNYKTANIAIGIFNKNDKGKGLALEILEYVTSYLLDKNKLDRIGAEVELDNSSSLKLCKKLENGLYRFEGIKDNAFGKGYSCKIYSACN